MDLLSSDMEQAVDGISMSDQDKELVRDILYNERQNKERDETSWSADATKYIQNLFEKTFGDDNERPTE